ncbi:MAG: hypothetical protein R3F56_21580 [Planctomycetota bacterium]
MGELEDDRDGQGQATRPLRWLAAGLTAAAVFQLALCVVSALHLRHDLPRWDDVKILWKDLLHARDGLGWSDLFGQQNEHRIPFPRLFFRADWAWAGATGRLMLAAQLSLQVLHVVVLALVCRHLRWRHRPAFVAMTAAVTLLLFSCHQLENFVWRVQISSVLVYMAASASFWLVLECSAQRSAGRRVRARVAGVAALAAAFVANYSRADGNLVWPLMVLLAWRLSLPRWIVAVIAAVGALSVGAYFVGYTTPPLHTSPLWTLVHDFPRAVAFACVFLGAQVADLGVTAAGVVGAVGVVIVAASVAAVALGRVRSPGAAACVAVMLFACGSAGVTALGRSMDPLQAALAHRYATPALLMWAGLVPIAIELLVAAGRRTLWRTTGWVVVLAFLGVGLIQQGRAVERHQRTMHGLERATMAVASRVCDLAALYTFCPPQPHLAEIVDSWRSHRVSVFRAPTFDLLGRVLAEHTTLGRADTASVGARGAITAAVAVAGPSGGVEVRGWIATSPDTTAAAPVVLTDRGVVVGFASCRIEPPRADGTLAWVGYARTVDRVAPLLEAHVFVGAGEQVLPLEGAVQAPSVSDPRDDSLAHAMAAALVGPPLPSFEGEFLAALGPWAAAVGQRLDVPGASDVAGAVDVVEARPGRSGAVRLQGWVDAEIAAVPRSLVLLDDQDRLVGGGRLAAAEPRNAPLRQSWTGWAVSGDSGVLPSPYFVAAGSAPLRLQAGGAGDSGALVSLADLDRRVETRVTVTGAWTRDGELTWFLPLPDAMPIADSWAGSDRNLGSCTLGPFPLHDRALGIPVLVGPDAKGQIVRAFDAVTGAELETLDTGACRGRWRVWRLRPTGEHTAVLVEAEDRGSGWGQWQALGPPHWLR